MRRTTTRALGRPVTGALALSCALILSLLASQPAMALHSVFVGGPNHSEEALTWCGPAVAETVMESYPSGACDEAQADIWAEIALHRVEGQWDTDPAGLRGAMASLCPPPAGGWSIFSRTDAPELMFSVAFWMTKNQFPVAALLSTTAHNSYLPHEEHWVVIKGVVTDADPTTTSPVDLDYIWITDPSPATFGDPPLERFLSGGAWYAELQAVTKVGSAYTGKYVAIIEPPQVRGVARARLPLLVGRVLPPDEILERARKWLDDNRVMRELKPFAGLSRTRPLEPLLVDAKHGGYYLVPFSADGETARHALVLNAYDGSFMEAGAFAPTRFLGEKEAVERALEPLGVRRPQRVGASLSLAPAVGRTDRFHPVWRVEIEGEVIAVRQDGTVRRWPKRFPID